MMFSRLAGTALLAAILMPACLTACQASPAKKVEGTPAPTSATTAANFPVDHEAWSKMGFKLDWVGFPFPRQGRAPKVVNLKGFDDVVIAQESDSTVTVMETGTGQRRWSTDLTGPLTRFVSLDRDPVDSGNVILTSESETFILAIANGNLVGRESFDHVVNTAGVMEGPLSIYGTSKGEVLAHRRGIGVKAWGFGTGDPIEAAPVRVGGSILVVNQAGGITALTPSGRLIGRNAIYGGTASNPVTDGSLAFIAGLDQSVWAFDSFGSLGWRYRTPGPVRAQPAVFGTVLYVEIPQQGLTALGSADGSVKWSNRDVTGTVIAVRGSSLFVWNAKTSTITLVDAARGDVIATAASPGIVQLFTDGGENSPIYAVSDKGVVARFVRR